MKWCVFLLPSSVSNKLTPLITNSMTRSCRSWRRSRATFSMSYTASRRSSVPISAICAWVSSSLAFSARAASRCSARRNSGPNSSNTSPRTVYRNGICCAASPATLASMRMLPSTSKIRSSASLGWRRKSGTVSIQALSSWRSCVCTVGNPHCWDAFGICSCTGTDIRLAIRHLQYGNLLHTNRLLLTIILYL